MASSAAPFVSFPSQGGLNSEAPLSFLQPDELAVADNIEYGLHGERRKRRGTTNYNTTGVFLVSSASNVTALADFWRYGDTLTGAQRFVATAGSSILRSTGGGGWTAITASSSWGTNTSKVTNIVTGQGFAVFSNGVDDPVKWDQTTLSTLGASAPKFTSAAYHLRRLWTAGNSTAPSRVDLCAGGDITLWTGADTMPITLDEDDGDYNVGISQTFHKRLYVFKGPNKGSIHELGGNTLASLTHDKVFSGLPVLNHKAIITTPNDIFWLSRMGVHSLVVTAAYGDTLSAFLSKPIQNIFEELLALGSLDEAVGFWDPLRGHVGWFVIPSGETTKEWALIYHYLISDSSPQGKKFWSVWKFSGGVAGYSAAVMLTPANPGISLPRLYIGGTADGMVYAGNQAMLNDGTAVAPSPYAARVRTGALYMGAPLTEKQFYSLTTFYRPMSTTFSHDLTVTVDNRVLSTSIIMGGGGDALTS